jgi:hypothetical protein
MSRLHQNGGGFFNLKKYSISNGISSVLNEILSRVDTRFRDTKFLPKIVKYHKISYVSQQYHEIFKKLREILYVSQNFIKELSYEISLNIVGGPKFHETFTKFREISECHKISRNIYGTFLCVTIFRHDPNFDEERLD